MSSTQTVDRFLVGQQRVPRVYKRCYPNSRIENLDEFWVKCVYRLMKTGIAYLRVVLQLEGSLMLSPMEPVQVLQLLYG